MHDQVPFGGALDAGLVTVNENCISVTFLTGIYDALRYSRAGEWKGDDWGWNPQDQQVAIEQDLAEENRLKSLPSPSAWEQTLIRLLSSPLALERDRLIQKRMLDWRKLSALERSLVRESFPVIYGIRPLRKGVILEMPRSDSPTEVALLNGAPANEIRVLYVPENKMGLARSLLRNNGYENIRVAAIAPLLTVVDD